MISYLNFQGSWRFQSVCIASGADGINTKQGIPSSDPNCHA
jgi:hypothetical protein